MRINRPAIENTGNSLLTDTNNESLEPEKINKAMMGFVEPVATLSQLSRRNAVNYSNRRLFQVARQRLAGNGLPISNQTDRKNIDENTVPDPLRQVIYLVFIGKQNREEKHWRKISGETSKISDKPSKNRWHKLKNCMRFFNFPCVGRGKKSQQEEKVIINYIRSQPMGDVSPLQGLETHERISLKDQKYNLPPLAYQNGSNFWSFNWESYFPVRS